jgi:hypothetical protein
LALKAHLRGACRLEEECRGLVVKNVYQIREGNLLDNNDFRTYTWYIAENFFGKSTAIEKSVILASNSFSHFLTVEPHGEEGLIFSLNTGFSPIYSNRINVLFTSSNKSLQPGTCLDDIEQPFNFNAGTSTVHYQKRNIERKCKFVLSSVQKLKEYFFLQLTLTKEDYSVNLFI